MHSSIDLHTHSHMSDGSYSPRDIIRMAFEKGIKAIALTDHDIIDGNFDAQDEANKLGVEFLSGVEISARYKDDRIIHILGLGIDTSNKKLLNTFENIKNVREKELFNIIKILKNQGISIDIDILKKRSLRKSLDRYDIYRYFIEERLCTTPQQIWDKYLDPIPYNPDELMDVYKAIEIIKESNGLSFLAHYNKKIGLEGYTKYELEEHIVNLKSIGLDGIEQYYPSYSAVDMQFVDYLIRKYGFVPSGGTDFHGDYRAGISLGTGHKNFNVPFSIFENIKSIISSKKYR